MGGYDPRWVGTPDHVSLQAVFLKMQRAQEDAFRAIAALRPEPCVLLHDRGALDGSSFCSDEEWGRVLEKEGTTENLLFARYDLVLHLASTASDEEFAKFYQYGEGSNNPARFHSPQQAKLADRKSQQVRSGGRERGERERERGERERERGRERERERGRERERERCRPDVAEGTSINKRAMAMVSSSLRSILSGCNDYMQGGADPGSILYRSHPGIRTTSVLRLDLQLSDFRGEGSPHVRGVGIPCSRVTSTNRQSSSSFTHRQSPTNLESVWVRRSSSTHSTYENKNSCYLLSLHSDTSNRPLALRPSSQHPPHLTN
jgi:hypothetical protein